MSIYLIQLLSEALGVPENMLPMAAQVYDGIVDSLRRSAKRSPNNLADRSEYHANLKGPFKVDNMTFSVVRLTIEISPDDNVIQFEPAGAAFSFAANLDPKSNYRRLVTSSTDEINLRVVLAAPGDDLDLLDWEDVFNYIIGRGKGQMLIDLNHELKHAFDKGVTGEKGEDIINRLKYSASTNTAGFPPLDNFHYLYYYTNFIENLVRPTEFASELETKNITKKDFLKTFQNSEIYKTIQDARAVSYEKLLNSIVSEPRAMDSIKQALTRNKIDYSTWSDEKVAEFLLDHQYKKFRHDMKISYLNYLLQDEDEKTQRFFQVFGVDPNRFKAEKKKAFEEVSKEIDRFGDNFKAFYQNEAKEINRNAEKIYRKLAKLYAYIQ